MLEMTGERLAQPAILTTKLLLNWIAAASTFDGTQAAGWNLAWAGGL